MFVLEKWGDWSNCSAECGGGVQTRDHFCGSGICGRLEVGCHLMPCDGKSQLTRYLRQQTSPSSRMCTNDTPYKMDHVTC